MRGAGASTPRPPAAGYHSVYRRPAGAAPVERWTDGVSHAFVHDVMAGPLPAEFESCDVLYADLPWQAGFAGYNDRAGVGDGRTYRRFLDAVAAVVAGAGRPVVLVTGRHALRHLPSPAQVVPLVMPVLGQPAVSLLYNLAVAEQWDTTEHCLARLAIMYRRVGDFCCGYGASARAFRVGGGSFVASDYNAECVGYVAAHASAW